MPPKSGDPLSEKWLEPRFFARLHRHFSRVFTTRRDNLSVGFACRRCRAKKIKCDGERPCGKCKLSHNVCEDVGKVPESQTSRSSSSSQQGTASPKAETVNPEFPVSSPNLYTHGSTACSAVHANQGQVTHPFFKKMCDIGLPPSSIREIVAHLPSTLSDTLRILADRASGAPPGQVSSPLDIDLQAYTPTFPGCLRSVHALNPVDGTALGVSFSSRLGELFGAHSEELAARVFNREMPVPQMSEYRVICYVLQSIHDSLFPHQAATCVDALRWGSIRGTPRVALVRITFRCVQQGGVMTHAIHDGCEISPDEFDRHRRDSSRQTTFLDCSRRAVEFVGGGTGAVEAQVAEEESIRGMMSAQAGRAKLEQLARKVTTLFRLDSVPPWTAAAAADAPR